MIDLETLLPTDELSQWQALIREASTAGAGAITWHSATSEVLVFGIVQGGELLTWFASPASTPSQAAVVQAVITAGLHLASTTLQQLAAEPVALADAAIQKARRVH